MTALAATVIDDEAVLAGLEPAWWALWRRCPAATPFQSPAWLLAWWHHFHPGRLHAVAVHRGDALVALAPAYVEDGPLGRRLLPMGISLSDYLDLLVDPEVDGALDALARSAQTGAWDAWSLEDLPPDAAADRLPAGPDVTDHTASTDPCPVLPLAQPPDLSGCVPARRRRQWRRAHAAADRRGRWSIEAGLPPDTFLDHLFRLHAARWQSRGEGGVLADPIVQAFHRAALPALHAAGLVHRTTMQIEGKVVGAYYGFLARDRAYAYLGGFDPDYTEESPGSLLLGDAIASAIRQDAREFHFLRGGEAYKYAWGGQNRWNHRRTLTSRSHAG